MKNKLKKIKYSRRKKELKKKGITPRINLLTRENGTRESQWIIAGLKKIL